MEMTGIISRLRIEKQYAYSNFELLNEIILDVMDTTETIDTYRKSFDDYWWPCH